MFTAFKTCFEEENKYYFCVRRHLKSSYAVYFTWHSHSNDMGYVTYISVTYKTGLR